MSLMRSNFDNSEKKFWDSVNKKTQFSEFSQGIYNT